MGSEYMSFQREGDLGLMHREETQDVTVPHGNSWLAPSQELRRHLHWHHFEQFHDSSCLNSAFKPV